MPSEPIRYFGATIAFDDDCQELSPVHGIMVSEAGTNSDDLRTVADMVHHRDHLRTPVEYVVLPF